MNKLGEYIKQKREEIGKTQDYFNNFGITGSGISRLELGKNKGRPKLETLQVIAKVLDINLNYLIQLANQDYGNIDLANDKPIDTPEMISNEQFQDEFNIIDDTGGNTQELNTEECKKLLVMQFDISDDDIDLIFEELLGDEKSRNAVLKLLKIKRMLSRLLKN